MPWQIDISSDSMTAKLDLRKLSAAEDINLADVIAALKDKDVKITKEIDQRLKDVLEQLDKPDQQGGMPVLIEGKAPTAGVNGYFEWAEAFDPEKSKKLATERKQGDQASFYERSALIIAKKDDHLGILHLPTDGLAGEDILGRSITPQPGADIKFDPGKNVQLLPDGKTFVACCDGEPKLENGVLSVDPVLTIKTNVDFETGNINYSGEVHIKGDIKDLFEVIAAGDVNVEGTIEAAKVECDGSLTVKRGIAGKEKASIEVKKDLSAKYLSNATIWVHGDVAVDSEIVNMDLNCRGKVTLTKGAIHGGQVTAAGNIEAPIIGSTAGVKTVIRAGLDPVLEKRMKDAIAEKAKLTKMINMLMPRAKTMLQICKGKPNDELRELADNIKQSKERIQALDQEYVKLQNENVENCTGKIIIHKVIYPGVTLYVGDIMHVVDHEMTGPMEVVPSKNDDGIEMLSFQGLAKNTT